MTSRDPTATNDQASTALVNAVVPPDLKRELSDDELAIVAGGHGLHVELPIIVEGPHGGNGGHFDAAPFGRHGRGF